MDSNIYEEILPIYQAGKIDWQEVAEKYNFVSKSAAKNQFRRERIKRKDMPVSSVEYEDEQEERERTTYTENDDSIHVVCDSKRIRTREDVIEHFNVDTNVWKIKEFTVKTSEGYRKDRKVKWDVEDGVVSSGHVEDTGKILVVPMVHTVTTFVRKEALGITFEDIDNFFKTYDAKNLSAFSSARQYALGGLTLEIDLADAHVGNESLSFEELKKRVEDLVAEVKRKSKGLVFEKIILVQLGDIFHFDTYNRTTTSGTQITYSSDQFTMFDNGLLLMTWLINELAEISKVDVVNIYGNHDKSSSYMLAKTLEAGFKNDPNVTIDAKHSNRKFREIGSTSVAYIHGDMSKKNIYDTFQKEEREMFGRTLYSEIHCGHIHHEVSMEQSGVILRWVPSLTIPDQWHKDNGYTGAKQATQCFIYDSLRDGHVDIWTIPVHNQRRKSLT